jgi:outer membrane protein assembly factor BamB
VGETIGNLVDAVTGPTVQKPADLVPLKPVVNARVVWQASAGNAGRYAFSPLVTPSGIYVASGDGTLSRLSGDGKVVWRVDTKEKVSGGVGGDGRIVMVGTAHGRVLAFDSEGKPLWQSQVTSEVLAPPQSSEGIVVVRSGDNRMFGLDAANGTRKWFYQRALPPLAVRSFAPPAIVRGGVFTGFPGGRLVALALPNGAVGWDAAVALPKGATELERAADVTSTPVVDAAQVCAVAFQGRVACFDPVKGAQIWARDASSTSGLAQDSGYLFVSEDKGAVVAFDKRSGTSLWRQDKLTARRLSTPAVYGRFVVVGDLQGYVHIISREDGSFAARVATDGSPINSPPVLHEDGFIVQTRNGGVYAIRIE